MTVHDQVFTWLETRGWLYLSDHRGRLAGVWREVSTRYGDESPAACGCLLAIVREACGDANLSAFRQCNGAGTREAGWPPDGAEISPDGGWVLYAWFVSNHAYGKAVTGSHRTELAALAAALRAAPPRTEGP